MDFLNIAAIVLAAGKGKRMNSQNVNKVVSLIGKKPMISLAIETLSALHLGSIIVVVGFAKESVQRALKKFSVEYAVQKEQLGTAHALECGFSKISSTIEHVLVIQGDDSAFYTPELLISLIKKHIHEEASMTMLTVTLVNPTGLGRIVRDTRGNIVNVVEEKDASKEERQITEVNPACYVFTLKFLRKYLQEITRSTVTGEYYLTSLVDSALQHGEKIATLNGDTLVWRGVNTPKELKEAKRLFRLKNNYA